MKESWPEGLVVPQSVQEFLSKIGRKDPVFEIKSDESALLVIDMQNDFILPGAPLPGWKCLEIVPNISRLIEFCRAHNIPVVWAIDVHSGEDMGLLEPMWPRVGPNSKEKALVKGTPGAQIHDKLPQPLLEEIVIEKHRYSAFYQTDLELHLRTMGVKTLIITGMHTNICCQTTARDGFMRDFQIAYVSDAVTSFTKELHQAGLIDILVAFGRVCGTQQIINELQSYL